MPDCGVSMRSKRLTALRDCADCEGTKQAPVLVSMRSKRLTALRVARRVVQRGWRVHPCLNALEAPDCFAGQQADRYVEPYLPVVSMRSKRLTALRAMGPTFQAYMLRASQCARSA